jgi:glycerophosphoryl diester phosphodiesterase
VSSLLCIGHRGACGHEPENTLRSVRRALEFGVQGIEIDVRAVRGELFVLHDATVNRTTNGTGYLTRKTFAQIHALDAGHGERIPTLREVFETVERRAFINIELKGRSTALPVSALIEEFIGARGWSYNDFLVSSFYRRELRRIINPRIRLALLVTRPSALYHLAAKRLRCGAINVALRHVTAHFVEDAHRRGLAVFVYTVNSAADIARMRDLRVDGVFSDFPERVLDAR